MHIQRIQNYNHQTAFKQICNTYGSRVRVFNPETQKVGPWLDDFNLQVNLVSHVYKSPLQEELKPGHIRVIVELVTGKAFEFDTKDRMSELVQSLNSSTDGFIAMRAQQQDAARMRETTQQQTGRPQHVYVR